MYSEILSGAYSDIVSGILSDTYSDIRSGILSDIIRHYICSIGHSIWHSIWHNTALYLFYWAVYLAFYLTPGTRRWGPAVPTEIWGLRCPLRSGARSWVRGPRRGGGGRGGGGRRAARINIETLTWQVGKNPLYCQLPPISNSPQDHLF